MIQPNVQLPSPTQEERREKFATTEAEFAALENVTEAQWKEYAEQLALTIREELPSYCDLSGELLALSSGEHSYEFDLANRMSELIELQEFNRATVDAGEQDLIDAALDRARAGLQEKIGATKRTKRWWARGQFWALIAGGDAALFDPCVGGLFSALALKEHSPDEPNAELAARARERCFDWLHLSDACFFQAFAKYIFALGLSLETQAYLLFFVRQYFPVEPLTLAGGESTSLCEALVAAYDQSFAAGQKSPDSAVYACLAHGLVATDSTGRRMTLSRAQSAGLAVMAFWKIIDRKASCDNCA